MIRCYTCVFVAQWVSILSFCVMQGALVPCHPCGGAHWDGHIGGSTLRGVSGADSGLFTIGDGMRVLCSCGTAFGGSCSCVVMSMFKISESCLRDDV